MIANYLATKDHKETFFTFVYPPALRRTHDFLYMRRHDLPSKSSAGEQVRYKCGASRGDGFWSVS